MPLCCCLRRRRTNRVEEAADKRAHKQETLHYPHRDGVVTVTCDYSHPSLRGTVTQRNYKSMDDIRGSRQAASQLARAASVLGWGDDPFAFACEVTVQEWHDKAAPNIPLYYWSRRVGGTTTGVMLRSGAGVFPAIVVRRGMDIGSPGRGRRLRVARRRARANGLLGARARGARAGPRARVRGAADDSSRVVGVIIIMSDVRSTAKTTSARHRQNGFRACGNLSIICAAAVASIARLRVSHACAHSRLRTRAVKLKTRLNLHQAQ